MIVPHTLCYTSYVSERELINAARKSRTVQRNEATSFGYWRVAEKSKQEMVMLSCQTELAKQVTYLRNKDRAGSPVSMEEGGAEVRTTEGRDSVSICKESPSEPWLEDHARLRARARDR